MPVRGFDLPTEGAALLEVVAIGNESDDWPIRHAQTPPQERVNRELGFEKRSR